MKIRRNAHDLSADADMTPMIDMTFQLIAFFMVLLNFGEGEQDQRIHLPASDLAKPPDAPFEAPLVLQLTKEGTVLFAGDELTIPALRPMLLRERQVLERSGRKPSDATIIIRADGDAKSGKVQELIKACQAEKYETFALRAMQEEDGKK